MLRRVRSRYTGSHAGYLWAFIEPLVWVYVIKLALQHGNARPPVGQSFEVFLASGIIMARTWRQAVQQMTPHLVKLGKQTLPTLHRLDTIYALWLLEMITGAIVLIVMLSMLHVFGQYAKPADLLICILAYMALSVFTLAFGLSFGLLMKVAPVFMHFRGVLLLVMFITSGFSIVADRAPQALRDILVWNPLMHSIEWFREGFYAGYECRALSLVYLFGSTIALLLLGLAGERALRRRSKNGPVYYEEDDAAGY